MADACARSLGATLVAAVSSYSLFVKTSWDMVESGWDMVESDTADKPSTIWQKTITVLQHTIAVFAMPLLSFLLSVRLALCVKAIKSRLPRELYEQETPIKHHAIAIMTSCPIYIQIPTAVLKDKAVKKHTDSFKEVPNLTDLCPLQLSPHNRSEQPRGWKKFVQIFVSQDEPGKHKYLKLAAPKLIIDLHELAARETLLAANMAPEDQQLQFLCSQRLYDRILTSLQAMGYVLSIIQRMGSRLDISPLEAIVTFLSLLALGQLLLEFYACGHYQRPLLLNLNNAQVRKFFQELNDSPLSLQPQNGWILMTLIFLILGFSAPFCIVCYLHYRHSCLLCSVSALLFFASLTVSAICILASLMFTKSKILETFLLMCSLVAYVSSLIVALVSLIIKWNIFQSAPNDVFAWIIPHVSSR